jgi:branched-chain amino acid transport system permease protein
MALVRVLSSPRAWRVIGLAAVVLFPIVAARSPFLLNLAIFIGIYYIVCIGLSLIFGLAGQLSLAQAAFYGIGAYASAIVTTKLGLPVFVGFAVAIALTGVVGFVLAAPILRLRDVYLAMATLAFGNIVVVVIEQEGWLTGGGTGIINLPAPVLGPLVFNRPLSYYVLVWAVALVVVWIARNIMRSRIGLGLRAIGSSELGAEACGVDVARYKTWMFTLGATFAGIAGALNVHYLSFISPETYTMRFSILIVMILALGGMDSLIGAFLGAVFVVLVPDLLAAYREYSELIFAGLFIAVVMFMPRGMAGLVAPATRRLVGERSAIAP